MTSPTHTNVEKSNEPHRPTMNINHNQPTINNGLTPQHTVPHTNKPNGAPSTLAKNFPPTTPTVASQQQQQQSQNHTPGVKVHVNGNNNNNNNGNLNQHKSNDVKSHQQQQQQAKIDEKLEKMPWFHGLLTRENAEKLLSRDGDYLVRETNKAEKQYVLSGRYKGECRHIFLVDPSGVVSFPPALKIKRKLKKIFFLKFRLFLVYF